MRRILALIFAAVVASVPLSLGALAISPASACACGSSNWSIPEPVATTADPVDDLHTLTVDSTIYAVWVRPDANAASASQVIKAASYDGGVTWEDELFLGKGAEPTIMRTSTGKVTIFWVEDATSSLGVGRSKISSFEFDDNGGGVRAYVTADQDANDEIYGLTPAALPGGDVALSWIYQVTPTSTSNSVHSAVRSQNLWWLGSLMPAQSSSYWYQSLELTAGTLTNGGPTLVLSWAQGDGVSPVQVAFSMSPIPADAQSLAAWQWQCAAPTVLSSLASGEIHTEANPAGGFVFGFTDTNIDPGETWVELHGV